MPFQKKDLACTHYQEHDNDQQLLTGQPSRRIFDRFNSSQVLFVLNAYAAEFENFTLEDFKDIEMQIATRLPLGTTSEISVFNWIRNSASAERQLPNIF